MEKTFSIIKPDATKRNITGSINKIIEENGLRIVAQKRIKLSTGQAKDFYQIHSEKSFFNDLIEYMTSEPVVVQVLLGNNAVETYRKIMGATNPANAEEGTIRKTHALNVQENSVHGSDSKKMQKKKLHFFLKMKKLLDSFKIQMNII